MSRDNPYSTEIDWPIEADPEQYGRREDAAEAARCGEPWPPWAETTAEQYPTPKDPR